MRKYSLVCFLILLLAACTRQTYQAPQSGDGTALPGPTETKPIATVPNQVEVATPAEGIDVQTVTADWESLYTVDKPTRDREVIIRILDDLHDRAMAQIDKAGWYREGLSFSEAEDISNVSTWVHVTEPEIHKFDSTVTFYYYPEINGPDSMQPGCVLSPEGDYGKNYKVDNNGEAYFYNRSGPEEVFFPHDLILDPFSGMKEMPEKTWENLGWFICQERGLNTEEIRYQQRWLMNEQIANCPKAEKVYQYEAWVDLLEAEPVFIFKRSIDYLTPCPYTAKGIITKTTERLFFNLQTGSVVASDSVWEYESGEIESSEPAAYNHRAELVWFEELPEMERKVYEHALQLLRDGKNYEEWLQ